MLCLGWVPGPTPTSAPSPTHVTTWWRTWEQRWSSLVVRETNCVGKKKAFRYRMLSSQWKWRKPPLSGTLIVSPTVNFLREIQSSQIKITGLWLWGLKVFPYYWDTTCSAWNLCRRDTFFLPTLAACSHNNEDQEIAFINVMYPLGVMKQTLTLLHHACLLGYWIV